MITQGNMEQETQINIEEGKFIRAIGKWMLGIAGIILAINLICRLADAKESMEYTQVTGTVTKVQTISKWTRAGRHSTKLSSYCVWVDYQPQGYPIRQTITESYSNRLFQWERPCRYCITGGKYIRRMWRRKIVSQGLICR